jgi:hypothetical protein
MAATVCPSPQFVGLDNSGNPLSGGKLYSYSAGTTTNLNTFSDSDLSVANANPVILDAGGRATVYLSASSYKFKLTSSGDDVIYTQDNVISSAPYDVDLDVPFVAGEAVTAGQAIYLSDGTGSRTAGRWYLADSDTAAYSSLPITGFAVDAVALAATGSVRLLGIASVPGTLSVGSTYYVAATPGAIASSAGTFSKAMGVADTASTLVMTVQQTISQVANLLVTGTLRVNGVATFDVQPILSSLTASQAVFSDGSKGLVSNAITGTGNVVMSASPTLTGTIGAAEMTLSTPLPVASGGTGIAAITANALMLGADTSDVTLLGPGANLDVVTSNGTIWTSAAPASSNAYAGSAVSGRLTLTSGTSVTTADVTGAATIYWTPYNGAVIDLYTGSEWTQETFAELSIAASSGTASKPHDIFLDYNGGSPALAILAWTNDTTRATALALQDSILIKTGDTQQRYLGTVYLDGSKQCADSYAKRWCWNYYNRVTRPMRVIDSTDAWTYTSAAWRQANASAANQVDIVCGVAQDGIEVSVFAHCNNSSGNVQMSVSVGENSTSSTATGALIGRLDNTNTSSVEPVQTTLRALPAAGRNYYVWLEYSQAAGTTTWYGDNGATNIQSGIVAMWWG